MFFIFSFSMATILIILLVGQLWYYNRTRFKGLSLWLIGYSLSLVGKLPLAFINLLPASISSIAGNTLVVVGMWLIYLGLTQFVTRPSPQKHNYLILTVFAVLMTFFSLIHPFYLGRVWVEGVTIILISAQCSWLLLRRVEARLKPVTYFAGLGFVAYAVVVLFQIIFVWAMLYTPLSDTLLQPPAPEAAGVVHIFIIQQMVIIRQTLDIALASLLFLMVMRRLLLQTESNYQKYQQMFNFLQTAIESLSWPFYIINTADYRVEIANSAAQSAQGRTTATTCYALNYQRDTPCTGPFYPCPLALVLAQKQAVTLEHIHYNEANEKVYFEIRASPIFDEQGQVVQMVESRVDISQRRQADFAQERNRIAQELHDAVSQLLSSASIMAEAVPKVWEQDPDMGRQGLAEVRRLNHGALAEMRLLLMELRPHSLVQNTIGQLISHLVHSISAHYRLAIDLDIQSNCVLPPEVQITFYRMAQECFNNIVKHACSDQVQVYLDCHPTTAMITVQDNGQGFVVADSFPGHFGLKIMQERAEKIGATLEITSQIGQGTQISLIWSNPGEIRHDE